MKLTNIPSFAGKISQNRNSYFKKNNIDSKKIVSAEIVHESKISIVSNADSGKIISGTDGLITLDKGVYLAITSADCLPIFLFEPKKEITGVVHAGWRSLEKNILANAIKKIENLGGRPEDILVGIGPAICQKHYEVGVKVADSFKPLRNSVSKSANGKVYLNIKKIAELQLLSLALKKENVEISPECTFELPEKYFSARRDKPKEIKAMIAVIGMRK